jgi:CheY-like chemotaxis protein
MYSELLQEEAEDQHVESFIPDLGKICAAGRHLLALVNGVLDLSKIEAGKMELYLETFDVKTLVDEVAATVRPLVEKRSNQFELNVADDTGSMYADVTKVRQILFNLLSNACKFTQGGQVSLHVTREAPESGEQVVFQIHDSGIGMTPEQLVKLFQPFTQADASTTRKYGGTGLGLAISKRFCNLMGGDISVTSEPGKGSHFVLRLPARMVGGPSFESAHQKITVPVEPTTAAPSTTVLVIDDDPAVRDLMSRFLVTDAPDIRAVTAEDGESGLSLARKLKPDLIFLDVLMPRMDGWAVLTALKAEPGLSEIPVVMLTLLNEPEMGYLLGASEYLTKPIDRDRLSSVLGKYRPTDAEDVVLLVEDDPATREVLHRTLARQKWKVSEAGNGLAALESVSLHKPALILLDLMMPEMDGFEFLEELRANPAWREIPVVILTSKDLGADEQSRLQGKVERILQKGAYTREALLREVKGIVAQFTGRKAAAQEAAPAAATERPPVSSESRG